MTDLIEMCIRDRVYATTNDCAAVIAKFYKSGIETYYKKLSPEWMRIEGDLYYFDNNGRTFTDEGVHKINGKEYCFCLLYTSFLSYEREAYYSLDGSDFRVTFDENILYRRNDFSLGSKIYGISLLGEDQTLMEIKTSGGIPLWMSETLTKHHLYKTSFSKYGSAYQRMLTETLQGGYSNV